MKFQRKTLFILFVTLVAAGCNPTRKLEQDQYLLNKNNIAIDNSAVSRDDLKTLIKQKPNRRILYLFRFHLGLYNMAGDTSKTGFFHGIRKWLINIGEEPAILDTTLTERTRKQFQLYLFRKGFFNATVSDTTVYKKNHKANVSYNIICGHPYNIRNVTFSSRDSVINSIINTDKTNSLLHSGNRYDEDAIEKERERIATELRNRGYYFFNKNYITFFDSDSSLNSYQVDLPLYVNRINENVDRSLSTDLVMENHHSYTVNNVYIQTDFNPKNPNAIPKDTSYFNDYGFLSGSDFMQFRKEAILRAIFFKRGDLFRQSDLDYTYSRLLDLGIFKFIKIIFNEVPRKSGSENYQLDVVIQLTPTPKQDYTIETEATRTGGNLGGALNIGYRNKNMFKGAEALDFKMKFAAEALRNFNDSLTDKKLFFFNSFEIGPELNLNIKRLLFIPDRRLSRRLNPRTNISTGFNYQQRPDYTRRIANLSFGYVFQQSPKLSYYLYFMDINSVKVDLSSEFKAKLDKIFDLNLLNSYSTHLIPGGRYTAVLTNQSVNPFGSFFYLKGNLEMAGTIVMGLMLDKLVKFRTDGEGRKLIAGIPYAQYVKPDFDFSYHQRLNQHNILVYRLAMGIGIEGKNSTFLPFEKSFFGGGANSVRAWLARTLGPGSYKNTINIEQTGDVKVESNIEVRTGIFKILEGAAFVDAGNIWTRQVDGARPGSQFENKNFLNELAIGAGLGLRFNFSFFILRLDGAVKLHDPALDLNDRWVYSKQKFAPKDITLNLAIGYPF